jgi:hypothetical protein
MKTMICNGGPCDENSNETIEEMTELFKKRYGMIERR